MLVYSGMCTCHLSRWGNKSLAGLVEKKESAASAVLEWRSLYPDLIMFPFFNSFYFSFTTAENKINSWRELNSVLSGLLFSEKNGLATREGGEGFFLLVCCFVFFFRSRSLWTLGRPGVVRWTPSMLFTNRTILQFGSFSRTYYNVVLWAGHMTILFIYRVTLQ